MSKWARAANRRRLYKPARPVGDPRPTHSWSGPISQRFTIGPYDVSTCHGCGYHVCSCQPVWACEHKTVTRVRHLAGERCATCQRHEYCNTCGHFQPCMCELVP